MLLFVFLEFPSSSSPSSPLPSAVVTYPTATSVKPTKSPLYHSPSLMLPSAVITYPKAASTTMPSYSASVAHAQSLLYLSPTSYAASLTMVTYTLSTKKTFSSSLQPARSHHMHKRFPYWAIATAAAASAIIALLRVVYIVRKRCKTGRRTMPNYLQADHPQDIQENIDEGVSMYESKSASLISLQRLISKQLLVNTRNVYQLQSFVVAREPFFSQSLISISVHFNTVTQLKIFRSIYWHLFLAGKISCASKTRFGRTRDHRLNAQDDQMMVIIIREFTINKFAF